MQRRTITSPVSTDAGGSRRRGFAQLATAMAAPTGESEPRERLLQICGPTSIAPEHTRAVPPDVWPLLARKHEFLALKTAAEGAFAQLLAASTRAGRRAGPELALLGWSLRTA